MELGTQRKTRHGMPVTFQHMHPRRLQEERLLGRWRTNNNRPGVAARRGHEVDSFSLVWSSSHAGSPRGLDECSVCGGLVCIRSECLSLNPSLNTVGGRSLGGMVRTGSSGSVGKASWRYSRSLPSTTKTPPELPPGSVALQCESTCSQGQVGSFGDADGMQHQSVIVVFRPP